MGLFGLTVTLVLTLAVPLPLSIHVQDTISEVPFRIEACPVSLGAPEPEVRGRSRASRSVGRLVSRFLVSVGWLASRSVGQLVG